MSDIYKFILGLIALGIVGCLGLLVVGLFFNPMIRQPATTPIEAANITTPTATPTATATATPEPTATPTTATAAGQPAPTPMLTASDPLLPSLQALGFSNREELINFFSMVGVSPSELHGCPGEVACIAITREKDASGKIIPFTMTNPTTVTFDGWRAAGQAGGQSKVPPGTWLVEGVTIRPWR